ncbi:hypothetical protein CDO73_14105 [Saccharibacillus sp. O23]|uniref:SLC13 family permease n=1 Tax=Saccharibacillus sp. O23 TaxID=2009338 RepID=UPI000B4E761B|nr:SLC13 family permease [Saccharibacillus sp. O23]OWR29333.1 hypothetical protein CDO73_14105 [Saccharibacillus sp. O23]
MISAIDTAFWPVYTAAAVFGIVYVLVVTEKINGAVSAILGALILLVSGIVDWNAALLHHIGLNALLLLLGMMTTAAAADRSGIVQAIALKILRMTSGNLPAVLIFVTLLAAFTASLLGSGPALLLLAPLILRIGKTLRIGPVPFLIMSVIACNLGGMTTLTGSVPNMMIGSAAGMDTPDFAKVLFVPAALLLLVHLALLMLIFRREMGSGADRREELRAMESAIYVPDRRRAIASLAVLILLAFGLVLHEPLKLASGTVAVLSGAAMLMVNARSFAELRQIVERMDFKTPGVLIGFYVLAGGLVETGIVGELAVRLLELANDNKSLTALVVFAVAGLFAAVLDPIPLTAAAIPLIQTIGIQMEVVRQSDLSPLWWALALGCGIGSSGTLAGSVAGVLAAGLAQKEGYRFSYVSYFVVAFPLTLLALAAGGWYLYAKIL